MELVVGATGLLGGEICRGLARRGRAVRALVRDTSDPAKVDALVADGVDVTRGDLKIPQALRKACQGITNVISTATSTLSRGQGDTIETVDHQGHLDLTQAAIEAGARHIVYISFPHIGIPFPLQDAKRAVEDAIRGSGVDYTILQPTIFWEVWCSPALGFDLENGKARVFGDGEGRVSWISLHDVKEAAIASLDNPAARNRTFVLGGPEVLTQNEIIRRFEAFTGRNLELEHAPVETLRQQYEAAEDPLQRTFCALMINCAEGGWEIDMTEVVEALSIELTSLDQYIQRAADR